MRHIGSGSIILAPTETANVDVGEYTLSFHTGDSPPTKGNEFSIAVPHGYGLGKISTSTDRREGSGSSVILRVTFIAAGIDGELVNTTYSLWLAD